MTVIGGPDANGLTILYTAYGGPAAPREPWDPGSTSSAREAQRFWSEHGRLRDRRSRPCSTSHEFKEGAVT